MSDNKVSLLINRQVPEFVRDEYPLFITFLEAYYEYLETKQGTQINDLISVSKDLRNLSDVDDSIEDFEQQFFNSFATYLPKDVTVDKAFLIKNVLPIYLSKGSEGSFKLLFRMLFSEELELIYPKNNVLRASDGKWTVDNILRIDTDVRSVYTATGNTSFSLAQQVNTDEIEVYVSGVLKTITTDYYIRKESKKLVFNTAPAANSEVKVIYTNFDIDLLKNRQITGVTSGATAIVEKSVKRIITDRLNLGFPFELFISDKTLVGTFSGGEEIQVTIIDDNDDLITLKADTFSIVNIINVINGGASYNVGDVVVVTGGGAITDATAEVEDIVEGYIDGIVVNYGGAGFELNGDIAVSGVSPFVLDLAIDATDTTGVANSSANTYTVSNDAISTYANTLISAADYGFPATVITTGENVSTVIADALSYFTLTNLGPISNVIVLFSNTSTAISPTIDANSPLFTANSNSFAIKDFKSVGRIKINNGGTGYQIGDEITFGSKPVGTNGRGAAAAVKAIDANGTITQIEIQPSRVSGTANITNNSPFIVGTGTQFGTEIRVGDRIIINNESRYINSISSTTTANVNVNWTAASTGKKVGKYGDYLIGGQGYTQNNFPTITVSSSNVSATNANVQISTLMADGESLTPFIGNTQPGQIISIKVVSGGAGYQYIPQVDLTGSGSGTATASAVVGDVYISLPGRWTTSDSILSTSERKLQGQDYYVDYSYITSSAVEFTKYKKVLKELLHPAGFVNYADLNENASFNANTITVSTTSTKVIAGTVNVANASIYITGTNTKFNVASSLGIIDVGSTIVVNTEIRVVASIINNTNISVTSAFTITANNEHLSVLNVSYTGIETETTGEEITDENNVPLGIES